MRWSISNEGWERRFEEPAPRRVVDGWHENAVLRSCRSWRLESARSARPATLRSRVGGQPEAQKAPSETSATKDAGALSFEQGFEFNGGFPRPAPGQHPACRGAADQVEVRSDGRPSTASSSGNQSLLVQAAIAAPRQGEHMVGTPIMALSPFGGKESLPWLSLSRMRPSGRWMTSSTAVACDAPRQVNGLLLRIVHGGCPLIAGTLDGPTVSVRNYMLIFACHGEFPKVEPSRPRPAGRLQMTTG